LAVEDFLLFIDGQSVTSGIATTTLAPGSYAVTETADAGYAASVWGGDCAADGTITLADGDVATCTITNDDIAVVLPSASLTVTKTVVNDDDGTLTVADFPLFIGGQRVTSGVASTTLAPGAHVVTETEDARYVASDWGGDCAADGTITLADGDVATCTITNDDIEAVVNGGGGGGGSGGSSRRRRAAEPVASTPAPVATTTTPLAATTSVTSGGGVSPGFPNTGFGPDNSIPYTVASVGAIGCALVVWTLRRRVAIATIDAV
jgi:hypothetical protein